MRKNKLLIIPFLLGIAFVRNANAAQFIDVSDGIEVSAVISLNELNRIRIEGGKIDGIRIAKGVIEYSRDEKSGDVFVNLVKRNRRPVNIFVASSSGSTFKLLLMPKDIPAEQIFLVERVAKNGVQVFDNYQDQLIDFYKSMQQGITPKDYKFSTQNTIFGEKIGDIKIKLKATYSPLKPNNFKGEIYEIKNKSDKVQSLNPQDFYKDGIRAIKFDSYILNPKEITKMYVISIAG